MKRLCIDLDTLPEEGKEFVGELDNEIFGIDGSELRSDGPLCYDIRVQRFENELFVQGKISALFLFRCVRCLDMFPKTISIDDFSASIEIDNQSVIDLSDSMREEIVLDFPAYPRCEESDAEKPCNVSTDDFGVDKQGQTGVNSPAPNGNGSVWDALNALGEQ